MPPKEEVINHEHVALEGGKCRGRGTGRTKGVRQGGVPAAGLREQVGRGVPGGAASGAGGDLVHLHRARVESREGGSAGGGVASAQIVTLSSDRQS